MNEWMPGWALNWFAAILAAAGWALSSWGMILVAAVVAIASGVAYVAARNGKPTPLWRPGRRMSSSQ